MFPTPSVFSNFHSFRKSYTVMISVTGGTADITAANDPLLQNGFQSCLWILVSACQFGKALKFC